MLLTDKPRMYLSYPITAIKEDNPELLQRVRQEVRPMLEDLFVVFDPLAIGDMSLASRGTYEVEGTVKEVSQHAARLLGVRTVERDFQFIDQSDFIVVVYLTEKLSPGVMNEMTYAHRNGKDVYAVYPYAQSPFLQEVSTAIFPTLDDLMLHISTAEFSARYAA